MLESVHSKICVQKPSETSSITPYQSPALHHTVPHICTRNCSSLETTCSGCAYTWQGDMQRGLHSHVHLWVLMPHGHTHVPNTTCHRRGSTVAWNAGTALLHPGESSGHTAGVNQSHTSTHCSERAEALHRMLRTGVTAVQHWSRGTPHHAIV